MITSNNDNKEEIEKNADFLASPTSVDVNDSPKLDANHSTHGDTNGASAKKEDITTSQERNVERGLPDIPMTGSDNSVYGNNCNQAEDVVMVEQHKPAVSPSRSGNETNQPDSGGGENRHKETLNLLTSFLKDYMPRDNLDQDSFDTIIVKMNKAAFLRKSRTQFLDNQNIEGDRTIDHEVGFIWHDDDLYNTTKQKNSLHSFINVVDDDFFYEIVDAVEAATNFILDKDTIKNIRQSLAIQDDGKKRRRVNLKVIVAPMQDGLISPILVEKDNTPEQSALVSPSEEIVEEKRRCITRRSARNRLSKHNEELNNPDETGLEALLSAMIELEQTAGRPTDLTRKIFQQRTLRNRKKNPNYGINSFTGDGIQRLFDDEGREVTKIIVGGKPFAAPKKRGPKRKRLPTHEKGNKNSNEGDVPFSLSLLDWHDRLPLKASGQGNKRVLPFTKSRMKDQRFVFTEERIDAIITSWEALDNANRLSNEIATLEPPRECHSDDTYGKWCSGLLHCLQSSARIFARHEFFYSDVDRAWFGDNPFHRDLIAHGIDIDTKLARAEWNAIRRKIRKKPRRFSRCFIDQEFETLNEYRNAVRKIQLDVHKGIKPKESVFMFQVLAPAMVGTTVTAYHHKAHLLHRGTVLVHDYATEAYLIQFEKKSLGYEWCADTEVASHGLPEIIFPLKHEETDQKLSFGSLPTGTNYGPLIEFYNKESQGSSVPIDISVENIAQVKEEVSKVVKKIAEREGLATFMAIIDMLLERKEDLLKTIEQYVKAFETALSAGDAALPTGNINCDGPMSMKASNCEMHTDFRDHLQWLQTNLRGTEKSLQAALAQLQVIYGKGYAGFPITTPIRSLDQISYGNAHMSLKAANAIDDLTCDVGNTIALQLCPSLEESKGRLTNEYQSCMISSACGMLITSDLFVELIETRPMPIAETIDSTLSGKLQHLEPETISNLPQVAQDALDLRKEAFKNLKESVAMLSAELLAKSEVRV